MLPAPIDTPTSVPSPPSIADWRSRATIRIGVAQRVSGMSKTTLYRLMDAGQLDSIVINHMRLIKVDSLRHLLEETSG